MSDLTIILQEQFLNKRVEIQIPARNEKGINHPTQLTIIAGNCSWVGENKILWPGQIQVTIDRTPCIIKHINHIKLCLEQ
jgi:hypothetical protein